MPGHIPRVGMNIARPIVNLDGQDNQELGDLLRSLLIVETVQGLYRCETELANWGEKNGSTGYLLFDGATVDFGKLWKIKLARVADVQIIFEGRITGLEAQFPSRQPPYITVLAEGRFQGLRMTRRTRTFEEVTDADIINRIASDHGLQPDVSVRGPLHRLLAQANQSDLAFLRERARASGVELWVEGNVLHAKPRNSNRLALGYGRSLSEFSALADLAQRQTGMTVTGRGVSDQQVVNGTASALVARADLDSDQAGGSGDLSSVLAARKNTIRRMPARPEDEASAAAETFFRDGAGRFLAGYGVAEFTRELRAGATVDLQGLGPLFSGKYYVSAIQHLFDNDRGFRTEFVAERPGLGSN